MLEAKTELKNIIITEKGEKFFNKEITKRIKKISEFKEIGDYLFGRDDQMFRDTVIKAIIDNLEDRTDSESVLYEVCMTDFALDAFMDNDPCMWRKF